jgi:hypothetical protein
MNLSAGSWQENPRHGHSDGDEGLSLSSWQFLSFSKIACESCPWDNQSFLLPCKQNTNWGFCTQKVKVIYLDIGYLAIWIGKTYGRSRSNSVRKRKSFGRFMFFVTMEVVSSNYYSGVKREVMTLLFHRGHMIAIPQDPCLLDILSVRTTTFLGSLRWQRL